MKTQALLLALLLVGPGVRALAGEEEAAKEEPKQDVKTEGSAPTEEAKPAEAPGASDKATIVFCRPGRFGGAALNTSVYIDGKEIADLDNDSYIKVALDAGKHKLRSDDEDEEFELGIEAGFFKGHGKLLVMNEDQGRQEFEKEEPDYAKDIRDQSLIVK